MIRMRVRSGLALAGLACLCGQVIAQSSVLNSAPMFSPRPQHGAQPAPAAVKAATSPPVTPATTLLAAPQAPAITPQEPAAAPFSPAPQPAPAPEPVVTAPQDEATRRELTNDITEPFYVLHPGDTVDVTFRYTPEFNDEVVIGPDGRASLKSTGDIRIAGRTLPELRRLIVAGSLDKLVNPDVAVSLKDFERPSVVVAGEVANPQRIELRRPTTALQAILIAGGPKDDAALGRVLLFRRIDSETAEVHVLHLGKYDGKTRAANDLQLEPNDMILVRHDIVSRIDRYVKLANIGVYFNPIGNNGIF